MISLSQAGCYFNSAESDAYHQKSCILFQRHVSAVMHSNVICLLSDALLHLQLQTHYNCTWILKTLYNSSLSAHESDSQPVSSVGMETTNVNMADNHTLLVSWAIQSKQFSFPPADTSIPMTLLMLLSALNASHMLHISAAFELQHNLTK